MEQSWKVSLLESWKKIASFGPNLLNLILILILGFVIAWLLKLVVRNLLTLIKFDVLSYRLGLSAALDKASIRRTPTEVVGVVIYWCALFLFFLIALGTLNIYAVDNLIASIFAYIPQFVIAVFVLLLGYFLSRFLSRAALIGLVNAQVRSARLIASLFQILILIFFLAMAIEQLGIARGIVVATFAISFGGVVLALAIAFGLGGKEMAKDILERRFRGVKEEKGKPDEFSHL
ncbi:MAG: hypothetical protein AMJ73_03035 [candidate division Zixibacteria bacterium SM1_73]|nr:MAG: hypothetical protein AMJ73_03035 [candidate division Zixibacteria bacterium SM1_73]